MISSTAIFDDGASESNETFGVTLTNATRSDSGPVAYSTTSTGTATLTIVNSAQPVITIVSTAVAEGNSGTSSQTLNVTLNRPYLTGGPTITVNYAVTGGTAVQGTCGTTVAGARADYQFSSGTLTFSPTDSSESIPLTICGDSEAASDDTIIVTLSGSTNASLGTSAGTFTITNDDGTPNIVLSTIFPSVTEPANPNSTPAAITLTANMSSASEQPVTVSYTTSNNTAVAGTDYDAASGNVTIATGSTTSGSISVNIRGDFLDEDNETFYIDLTGVSPAGNANITNGHATATIIDDGGDGAVNISLSNTPSSVGENAGTISINVSLDLPSGKTVTVNYSIGTTGDTATAGIDYNAPSVGTITFNPGEQVKTINIAIVDDNITSEGSEYLTITLSSPVNGSITDPASRQLYINDND